MDPEIHQILLAGIFPMGNLGMRVVDSKGEGFTVSESLFPDHQVFICPVAGSILYNTQTCRPAELKLYRNDTTNVQKIDNRRS